jgi:hypothetical protein
MPISQHAGNFLELFRRRTKTHAISVVSENIHSEKAGKCADANREISCREQRKRLAPFNPLTFDPRPSTLAPFRKLGPPQLVAAVVFQADHGCVLNIENDALFALVRLCPAGCPQWLEPRVLFGNVIHNRIAWRQVSRKVFTNPVEQVRGARILVKRHGVDLPDKRIPPGYPNPSSINLD